MKKWIKKMVKKARGLRFSLKFYNHYKGRQIPNYDYGFIFWPSLHLASNDRQVDWSLAFLFWEIELEIIKKP